MSEKGKVSAEDRNRLARLHQEVAGRLYEAALIGTRALGLKGEIREVRLLASEDGGSTPEINAPQQGAGVPRPRKVGAGGGSMTILGSRIYFVTDEGSGYYDYDSEMCVGAPS